MTTTVPAVDYLDLDGDRPRLLAQECQSCRALYFDRRNACAKCSGTVFDRRVLADEGVVKAYTIVHRAAPGQDAPYTSVVVGLDGGGLVKANLRGVTDPAEIHPGLRARLVTFPVGSDDEGTTAIAFGFESTGKA
ncbi:Zn-ribbon domain-containing OB-fold protein [Rhodococcus aetherivorans]